MIESHLFICAFQNNIYHSTAPPAVVGPLPVADLGVGPEGHRPQLKSDWPLKCPCPAEPYMALLSCHSSGIYVSAKSFEIQPVQRKLYM